MGLKFGEFYCDRPWLMTRKLPTQLTHLPSDGRRLSASVNPPIERASTLIMPDIEALHRLKPSYGRMGLAVHRELEAGLCTLESAYAAQLAPSGLAACALAAASTVRAGDHMLVADNIYGPARRFCMRRLRAMGVETRFFNPNIGADISDLFQENTKAIYLESPGSLTFDICDTPAITSVAKAHGISTIMDNTWGCGTALRPLELGVDISLQALTKYVVGHADSFGGAVMTADKAHANKVKAVATDWAITLPPDDAYLALRGLRTLVPRIKAHEAAGLQIARWLSAHPAVKRVLHPALPDHPDHALWQRDFTGANGLFGCILHPMSEDAHRSFFEALTLFGLGFSWGGYESLLLPQDPDMMRSDDHWSRAETGHIIRVHVGLEDPDDLILDLETAFAAAGKAND